MSIDSVHAAPRPPRLAHACACAALLALTVAALYPLAGHDYVEWDDTHNIFDNPAYNPPTLRGLTRYWSEPAGGLYVPVLYTLWYPLALLARHTGAAHGALDPRVFHVANVAAHALCVLTVYALLATLFGRLARRDGARTRATSVVAAAAVGAAVFAVHPVQVEAVAWISGMKDVLCGLLSAVALWLYVVHAADEPADRSRAPRRLACYLLATAALAAALLAKPAAVTVPVMAFAIDRWLLRRPLASVVGTLAPWFVLAIPVMLVTRLAQPVSLIPDVYAMTPSPVRLIVAGDSLAFYVRQVLWPARLALDYGRSPDVVAARPWAWLAWLVVAAVLALLWLLRRRARPLVVGAAVFLVGLTPVLGLVPFGAQRYSSVADHYLYLPMIGLALAAAWLASTVRPRVALAVAGPVLVVLAAQSWRQTWHWRDTRALFEHNLRVNPRSWTAHINLAAGALLRGDGRAAEQHSRAALALRPADGRIYTNLGVALGMQSRPRESADALHRAVELVPQDPASHYWFGEALVQLGRLDEAERHLRESLRLDPRRTDARDGLARLRAVRRPTTSTITSSTTRSSTP